MHRSSIILVALLGFATPGCYFTETADLRVQDPDHGLPMSTAAPPSAAEQIGLVHAQENGFYLFGLVPVVRMSLQGCLGRLRASARAMGADGIADIRFEMTPAECFRFSVFPIPDWSAQAEVTGTAYRLTPRDPRTGVDEPALRIRSSPPGPAPGR